MKMPRVNACCQFGPTDPMRLQFHQANSGLVMEKLHQWLETQFAERKTEPNSGLGKGHYVSVAALEGADSVLAESGNPTRQ